MARHQISDEHWGGWNPQRPDHRDREFLASVGSVDVAQTEFILPTDDIPVLDQGQQGSCTGHGPSVLVMFDQHAQGETVTVPSRAMIYYDARKSEGTTDQDSGAQVRDALMSIVTSGVCPDSEFPYSDQVFDVAPSAQDYADAVKQEALVYEAVRYPHVNQALASGFPVVCGATLYESFESPEANSTGVIPIPQPGEQVIGGHCFAITGFNSAFTASGNNATPPRTKKCRNSWGTGWGDHGNFYLPQWYWDTGNVTDMWVIRRIGAGK